MKKIIDFNTENKKVLGVTGPTGAGKSVFCGFMEKTGYTVLDCDRIYAEITSGPSACMSEIISAYGKEAANADGSLNRRAISAIVFAPGNRDKLELLNRITHKYVLDEVRSRIKASDRVGCLVDAPLLFQSGFESECDATLCVLAPFETRLSRLLERDGASREALIARMNAAPDDMWYIKRCRWTVYNSGNLGLLETAANEIAREIQTL